MKHICSEVGIDIYYKSSDGNDESLRLSVDNMEMTIYDTSDEDNVSWSRSIPIESAKELRDFLNYALKDSS